MSGSQSEPRTTERVRAVAPWLLSSIGLLALTGCHRAAPPFESYTVRVDVPATAGKPVPAPPEGALRPWRVWVNQEVPRQKKAPAWRVAGAKEGVLLDLADDGSWKCMLNPVHVQGKASEWAKVRNWVVSRAVRCSRDGFRTSVEGRVQAGFDLDGKETEVSPSAALYLRDIVAGQLRETVVVLEGEKVIPHPAVD